MIDSGFVKALNIISAVITILTAIGGGWAGVILKGNEWGEVLAATVFFFAFAVVAYFILLLGNILIGKLRRDCPVCSGRGRVINGYDEIMKPQSGICPKCKGDGLIW